MRTSLTSKLTCLVMAALIFVVGAGFEPAPAIEYLEDGVIIRDMDILNQRMVLSEDDRDLLMRIAIAEAGNQDTKGMALVMRVVINRWKHGKYGETISAVIFATGQFAVDGMPREGLLKRYPDMTEPQKKQVRRALAAYSWILYNWDESEGALYFCANGYNYYGDTHLFKYGGHWFSK